MRSERVHESFIPRMNQRQGPTVLEDARLARNRLEQPWLHAPLDSCTALGSCMGEEMAEDVIGPMLGGCDLEHLAVAAAPQIVDVPSGDPAALVPYQDTA